MKRQHFRCLALVLAVALLGGMPGIAAFAIGDAGGARFPS